MFSRSLFPLVALSASVSAKLASTLEARLDNGLAITPPLGWNSYNHYSCSPNESIIHSNAEALVSLGLKDLGYHYVTTDCGWTLPNRTEEGTLTWNPERFPSGYYALGEFIHGLGLGFGVYSDAGVKMCMTGEPEQAGSLSHEKVDAETFAGWGADLLKYDNCFSDASLNYPVTSYTPSTSPAPNFVTMSDLIESQNRSILFQICNWGVDFPSAWAPDLGNSWRVTNDIIPAYRTIPRILNQVVPQTEFAGPGRWLDLDMLEVGNEVFTIPEEQTHFSLWSIIKSPLMIGCALDDTFTSVNSESLAILKNEKVIGYNQDSLGVPASFRRRWTEEGYEVWAGPLSGNRLVVALINLFDEDRKLRLDLPTVGVQKAGTLFDVWNGISLENVVTSYEASVGAHGTILVELGDTTASGIYEVSDAEISGDTATFSSIYGMTSSSNYTATLSFSSNTSSFKINENTYSITESGTAAQLALLASSNNTLSITPVPESFSISAPSSTFYPSTSFTLSGDTTLTTCESSLCAPVGSKIRWLGPSPNNAALTVDSPTEGPKSVDLYFCNNDIAIATSWDFGSNTRNLTLSVNDITTRVELPLSGKSSELFSPGLGWQDTGVFNVLLPGFKEGGNIIRVSNDAGGLVEWGADLVGLSIIW
ncbi:alpha-galactosidase [Phlyctema vagabunda]|uniref:Alpha-galactosidase n=1 Tax=Phlyctema vagabunda TaxID=108571 RepID=A0ABR4P1L8_9HELO